jgi:hypothetical protein
MAYSAAAATWLSVTPGLRASTAAAMPVAATFAAARMRLISSGSLTMRIAERMWVQSLTATPFGLAWGWVIMPIMD